MRWSVLTCMSGYADNTEKEEKALAFATEFQNRLTASKNGRPLVLCPKNEAGTPKLVKLPPKLKECGPTNVLQ